MIEVTRKENGLSITGHARYAPIGQDIVCAGVSTLAQTLIASIEAMTEDKIEYVMSKGNLDIKYGTLSEAAQLLVESFFVGVEIIANTYPDNVRVSEH